MASLSSLNLAVGRATTEFARLSLRVNWTSREVSENMWYRLSAYLIERDDSRDFFDMLPDGNIHWSSNGNKDDYVGPIRSFWVRPNGASSRSYTLERHWDFGNQEIGNEEYVAVATISPEMRGDIKFSQERSANLG